ncbi:MAG: phosphonate C-P lyase system protein PhnG [Alphaproteobacteria bacterium]|nr:phosphonate C-P lyase system protein PhnG [Alphaproteobacteria bacterium]
MPLDDTNADPNAARKRWMSVLSRAGRDALEDAYERLDAAPGYGLLRPPETGLVMVQGRANGTGQRFNAGEMTVTRCSVRLGDGSVGHAYVAGRDRRHAELAALFDALLQDPARSADLERDVIVPLARVQQDARERTRRKSAATKVDFFTMVRGEDPA